MTHQIETSNLLYKIKMFWQSFGASLRIYRETKWLQFSLSLLSVEVDLVSILGDSDMYVEPV